MLPPVFILQMFNRFNVVPIGPEANEATLRARNGVVEVRFALVGCSQRPMPRMMGRLRCSLLPEEALDNCILYRVLKSGTEAVITVFLPDAGEFGLEVYASDLERDGSSYFAVSSLLPPFSFSGLVLGIKAFFLPKSDSNCALGSLLSLGERCCLATCDILD